MKLNRTGSPLTRGERSELNENWETIEKEFNDVVENISDEAFQQVIEGSKIDWSQMVATVSALPSNAEEGETRGVSADNKIYRYDGTNWVPIAEINLNPISEVDTRLNNKIDDSLNSVNTQLAQTEQQQWDMRNVLNYELNSKARRKQGITVFASDDGRIEEYTVAKPIFESEGVPQSIAIVPTWVGNPNFCTTEQLLELQDLGWEIMSHTKNHPTPFPSVSDTVAEIEYKESKEMLLDMGFDVRSLAYPGGNYGERERKLAQKHYRSARCSDDGFFEGANYTPLNTFELKTKWLDPNSFPMTSYLSDHDKETAIQMIVDDCKQAIDNARDNNGIAIISTHFANIGDDTDYQEMYREVIRYAKANTVVTTLNEALNRMGNIVEVGDFSQQGLRAHGDTHLVVGVDGISSGSFSVAESGRFTPKTYFSHFPFGVTTTPVYAVDSEGAPGGRAGTLINYRPRQYAEGNGFGWQEYIVHTDRMYKFRRDVLSNSEFGEWYSDSSVNFPQFNNFDAATPYSEFSVGVTISRVLSTNPNLSSSPENRAGTLTTYKIDKTQNSPTYSYQEYSVNGFNRVYRRRVISSSQFGEWYPLNVMTLSDGNNFDTTTSLESFPIGITYSIVMSDNPNISDAPEQNRGTLVTHRIAWGSLAYSYQEYHSPVGSATYKRIATGGTTWGGWRKFVTEVI